MAAVITLLSKTLSVLPGFKLSLGLTVLCLSPLVVLPFAMMAAKAAEIGWSGFWNTIAESNVLAAIRLSLRTSFHVMLADIISDTLVAWVLVRYEFPGRGLVDALVDLLFTSSTAVTGIALAILYTPSSWIGCLFESLGIKIALTSTDIRIVLIVVNLPFIVCAVQPILEELSDEYEETAAALGASRWTTFRRVLLPEITPVLLTGAGMMLARSTSEYGSVIFITGDVPMVSEVLPSIITGKLGQYDAQGTSVVALFMLMISFVILPTLNIMQWTLSRHVGVRV